MCLLFFMFLVPFVQIFHLFLVLPRILRPLWPVQQQRCCSDYQRTKYYYTFGSSVKSSLCTLVMYEYCPQCGHFSVLIVSPFPRTTPVIVTVAPFPIATPATFLISRSSVAFLPFSISPVNFLGIIFLCPSFHVFSSMFPSIPSAPDLPSDPSHIPVGSAAMPPLRSPGHKTLQFR